MEYLKGRTLQEHIEASSQGLDADLALHYVSEAISGLIYAAEKKIVHRDIKPANIFICDDGAVKLIDFEIARQEGGTGTQSTQGPRGTFDYMSPDFIDPVFHGDECSDVFSMGVCLHEAIAREHLMKM
jgi:serine/threonine-protein kinase